MTLFMLYKIEQRL